MEEYELSDDKIKEMLSEFSNFGDLKLCDEKFSGGFGHLRKVFSKKYNKYYTIKIIPLKEGDESRKEPIKEFRGKNIIKINQEKLYNNKYYIYLMEYSAMGDLQKFIKYYYLSIKNKYESYNPFLEDIGDNLMRYFILQIFVAMRTFYLGNLVHYDIKPNNFLLFNGLVLKIIDFSLLKKLDDGGGIPGGTPGYRTPESYIDDDGDEKPKKFTYDVLRKQDYFAIGATIFYIKYNKPMLDYDKNISDTDYDRTIISDIIIESIFKAKNFIILQKYQNKDFTKFLLSLISYNPDDRPDFDTIIRNKWLNQNYKEIEKTSIVFNMDEDELILELQKSDFLIKKRDYSRNNNEENIKNKNNYIYNKKSKFKFRKIKNI